MIDKNGMVWIKAETNNRDNKLYEGMNVKVRVQRLLGKQLVIPKTALVLRTNRKVVFTLKESHAMWNLIHRPISVLMAFMVLFILGIITYVNLPVSLFIALFLIPALMDKFNMLEKKQGKAKIRLVRSFTERKSNLCPMSRSAARCGSLSRT